MTRRALRLLSRIALTAATAASLVLCLATVAVWVRSYWVCETFGVVDREIGDRWARQSQWDAGYCKGWVSAFAVRSRDEADDLNRRQPDTFEDLQTVLRNPAARHHVYRNGGPAPAEGRPNIPSTLALGWRLERMLPPSRGWYVHVTLPCWALAGALAIPPFGWAVARRRRRARWTLDQRLQQRCISCGYDLRATPDCCPECGCTPCKVSA